MPNAAQENRGQGWIPRLIGGDPRRLIPASQVIDRCVRETGIAVTALPHSDPILSGALALYDRESGVIWYDASLVAPRRHLVLAHEFAHVALHAAPTLAGDHLRQQDVRGDNASGALDELLGYSARSRHEREADRWASDLLLPLKALQSAVFGEDAKDLEAIAAEVELELIFVQRRFRDLLLHVEDSSGGDAEAPAASQSVFDHLDRAQQAAARSSSRHVLVSAGPGTGKTRTLAGRYEFLVREKGCDPASILILTFSRRAAGELAERIQPMSVPSGSAPWIGTVHAYAFELLQRFGDEAGLRPGWKVISRAAAETLMDRCIAARDQDSAPMPSMPIQDMLRTVLQAKEQGIGASEFRALVETKSNEPGAAEQHAESNKLQEIIRFYELYDATLASANRLDFTDLLVRACRVVSTNDEVAKSVRSMHSHVLIDEFQDLTPAASKYIQALACGAQGSGVWSVGDELQTIYRFQSGASAGGMRAFSELFGSAEQFDLDVNYRSSQTLVSLSGAIAAKLTACRARPRSPSRCAQPGSNDACTNVEPNIAIRSSLDADNQFDGIASEIARLQEAGTNLQDQAVLCRTNAERAAAAQALRQRGIMVAEGTCWLQCSPVKRLMSRLEAISKSESGNGSSDAVTVMRNDPLRASPSSLLYELAFSNGTDMRRTWKGWQAGEISVFDLQAVGTLLREADSWERDVEVAWQDEHGLPTANRVNAFVQHVRRLLGEASSAPEFEMSRELTGVGVRVMTVHAAKGLEFEAVYVPNLVDGSFPLRFGRHGSALSVTVLSDSNGDEPEVDEESCLFFVAITRARRHLYLSYPETLPSGRIAKPSPFLRLAQSTPVGRQLPVKRWNAQPSTKAVTVPPCPSTEQSVLARPLTPTELETYEACPRLFLYQRQNETYGEARDGQSANKLLHRRSENNAASILDLEIRKRQRANIQNDARSHNQSCQTGEPPKAPKDALNLSRLYEFVKCGLRPSRGSMERIQQSLNADSPSSARMARAVNAITAGLFPPQPDSASRCAECQYCFVCPE